LNGTFAVGRAENISSTPAFASATYRYVVAHGVTLYLSSLNAMSQMLASMLAHSTHYVGVFDVNDLAFKGKALAMRSKTHTAEAQKRRNTLPTPQQLFVPKQLFIDACKELNVKIMIYNMTCFGLKYPTADYRFSVYIDKTRVFKAASLMEAKVCIP